MSCILCSLPNLEPLLYEDDLVYIVKTQKMKGHKVRIMACIKRHTPEPTWEEHTKIISSIYAYMTMMMKNEQWFLCATTHASIPEHFHYVACDAYSTDPEEMKLLNNTEKIQFPLKNNILIGIPAHNEKDHIAQVVRQAKNYGEVFVFCDGCTDETAKLASDAGAEVFEQHPNVGYGGALKGIFQYAKQYEYESLVILDGDGQHNPQQIPYFLAALSLSDIVIGNRFLGHHNTPAHRQLIIKTINNLLGVGDSQCGFRAYNKHAIEQMNITENGMGASIEVLYLSKDLRMSEVPCDILYEDEQPHSSDALKHGGMLAKTLFWTQLWSKPMTFLFTPAVLFIILGMYWLVKMFFIYQSLETFSIGLAIAGTGAVLLGALLLISVMQILISKTQLVEMKR